MSIFGEVEIIAGIFSNPQIGAEIQVFATEESSAFGAGLYIEHNQLEIDAN